MTNPMDDELRDAKRVKFLEVYAKLGVIGPAAEAAGVNRRTYARWREEDEEFNIACEEAFQSAVDAAEVELRNRAVEGTDEPVLYKGEPVWKRDPDTGQVLIDDDFNPVPFTICRKSDRLLEVYVRSHRPVYKEKSEVAVTGADGKELGVTVTYVLPDGKKVEDYDGPEEKDPLD